MLCWNAFCLAFAALSLAGFLFFFFLTVLPSTIWLSLAAAVFLPKSFRHCSASSGLDSSHLPSAGLTDLPLLAWEVSRTSSARYCCSRVRLLGWSCTASVCFSSDCSSQAWQRSSLTAESGWS